MALLLTLLALSIWLYQDAQARQMRSPMAWVALLWLSGPIGFAWYWTRRPLFAGELRLGGRAWVMLRAFLTTLTAYVVLLSAVLLVWLSGFMPLAAIIAVLLGIGLMFSALWLGLIIVVLLLAWFLRDSRQWEKGPTHPSLEGVAPPVWGDRLLKVIFLAGLMAVFVFTEPSHPEWVESIDWQAQPTLQI